MYIFTFNFEVTLQRNSFLHYFRYLSSCFPRQKPSWGYMMQFPCFNLNYVEIHPTNCLFRIYDLEV